jgi:NTP pyrophosphatase (non-canonical NTP hydrolase)
MSITREDILGVANKKEQLQMYEYWTPDDDEIQKDHIYKTPTQMVKEFIDLSGQNPSVSLYSRLIMEEFDEWKQELLQVNGSRTAELKELADLLYVIYGYAISKGWDLEGAFIRVHENNVGRMYQPDGTIKRREDGKIIKREGYPKPKLEDLV